jgi:putative SOS response-associated peptidase YedK
MCGRFTLRTPASVWAEQFSLFDVPDWPLSEPRYNIAPTQNVVAVRARPNSDQRELVTLRWGLIPSWARDISIGNRMINARTETVTTKPSYRSAFRRRRCLIVADGFYEWQKAGSRKQPYYFTVDRCAPFGFAGLWEHWKQGEQTIESCTLITTDANDTVRPVHDRMPVIVDPKDYDIWLDPAVEDTKLLEPVLRPFESEPMEAYPVDAWMNAPAHEGPRCLEPVS